MSSSDVWPRIAFVLDYLGSNPIHFLSVKSTKYIISYDILSLISSLPTDGFVLLIWWKLAVTWGNGPFWARWATFVAQCDKYAWTNMLFVNNLIPWKQKFGESSECMYHAWYLGVDFQLCAVLTPIFVTTFLRRGYRRTTILFELLLIALVTSVTFINTYQRDWSGHLMDGSQTLSFDRDAYINPFYRATPYVAGFITAQIWHEKSLLCPHLGLRKEVGSWRVPLFWNQHGLTEIIPQRFSHICLIHFLF